MKKYDAVVAGYVCVDLITRFKKQGWPVNISELLKPGKLIEIDGLSYTLGGVVANTGVAMKIFSKNVRLNGIIGNDFIGKIASSLLEKCGLADGIKTVDERDTAFGLVIAPGGADRIFLESPGCSQFFNIHQIDFDEIRQSRLFHFGYPPLLKQFYLDQGDQLLDMFQKIREMNVVTSLDFSLPDPESESGGIDWNSILKRILPYTDIFVPSLEEVLQIMMPQEYARIQSTDNAVNIIDKVSFEMIGELGNRLIAYGVKIVLIKAAHRGAYLCTGDLSAMNIYPEIDLPEQSWNYRQLWCEAYPVDNNKYKNASGAGDTSAAAFLSAILNGDTPENALRYANIAGRNNLYCYDLWDELGNWEEMTTEMNTGPERIIDFTPSENNNLKTSNSLL